MDRMGVLRAAEYLFCVVCDGVLGLLSPVEGSSPVPGSDAGVEREPYTTSEKLGLSLLPDPRVPKRQVVVP